MSMSRFGLVVALVVAGVAPRAQAADPIPIPGLYSTGVDDDGVLLPAFAADPHYSFDSPPFFAAVIPDGIVNGRGWLPNGFGPVPSQWIDGSPDSGSGPGNYNFSSFFDLTGFDLSTVVISGRADGQQSFFAQLNGGFPPINGDGTFSWTSSTPGVTLHQGANGITWSTSVSPPFGGPRGIQVSISGTGLPPPPTCALGAGTPAGPGKPNKNLGTLKFSPSVGTIPSPKSVKLKLSGTLENCTNFDDVESKYPISAGSFVATLTGPPGATCFDMLTGAVTKTKITVKWKGINPARGKLTTAASTDKSTLVSFATASAIPFVTFDGASAPLAGPKSSFLDSTFALHLVIDETPAEILDACSVEPGVKFLHFTGENGPSTLKVVP